MPSSATIQYTHISVYTFLLASVS